MGRNKSMEALRIVSGGQTGVDRGALDAALARGVDCGGWCPEGRLAEDGVIDVGYPLRELPGGGYAERTAKNVEDSDGTVVIFFGQPYGGTELTLRLCVRSGKPYLTIDGDVVSVDEAGRKLATFVRNNKIAVLNVAGPRQSSDDRAYSYARGVVMTMLEMLKDDPQRN